MEPCCEVCESFRPRSELKAASATLLVAFGERSVRLCRAHALIAANSAVSTLAELRALYAESSGQRSYVARRAPASSSGAPRTPGRRLSDIVR